MNRLYVIIIIILCFTAVPVAMSGDIVKHYDEHHNITGYTVIEGDRQTHYDSSWNRKGPMGIGWLVDILKALIDPTVWASAIFAILLFPAGIRLIQYLILLFTGRRRLDLLFGKIATDWKNTIIVAPSLLLDKGRFRRKTFFPITPDLRGGWHKTFDVKAAITLSNNFAWKKDKTSFSHDEDSNLDKMKNLVCIGGPSNNITFEILQKVSTNLLYIRYLRTDEQVIQDDPTKTFSLYKAITDDSNRIWEEAIIRKHDKELFKGGNKAFFGRYQNPFGSKDRQVCIIAGLHGRSTYGCAEYISSYPGKVLTVLKTEYVSDWIRKRCKNRKLYNVVINLVQRVSCLIPVPLENIEFSFILDLDLDRIDNSKIIEVSIRHLNNAGR